MTANERIWKNAQSAARGQFRPLKSSRIDRTERPVTHHIADIQCRFLSGSSSAAVDIDLSVIEKIKGMTHISDPHFAERVRESFDRQNVMHLIQATLPVVEHGRTEIHLPHWEGIEQQHGFVHGGVVGTIADSAAGYAAMTVVPASASVLTVEYKMNLVAPADGEKLIARGQVVRPGRTLIVTKAEVFAVKDGKETLCALMQQTIMVMHGKVEK